MDFIEVEKMVYEISKYTKLKYVNKKAALKTRIENKYINRIGLELAGYLEYFKTGSIQVMDRREIKYFLSKSPRMQKKIMNEFVKKNFPCFIMTSNLKLPKEILKIFTKRNIPVLCTKLNYEDFHQILRAYLENRFAPSKVISGVLMDIHNVGILLIGMSGIGKSECAFDLIERKHRLIADDAVLVKRRENLIIGYPVESPLKYHIELRGIGFINIKSLFGISSIRIRKRIELIINLGSRKKNHSIDRTGLREEYHKILGIEIPMITVPVTLGENVAKIVELIAIKYLSEIMGLGSSKHIDLKIKRFIKNKGKKRRERFFIDDFE